MKIKCVTDYRHNDKVGLIQIFYNNSGIAKYARLRQYKGYNSQRKPIFIYTKVEINSDIQQLLNEKLANVEHKGVGQEDPLTKSWSFKPQITRTRAVVV